MFKGKRGGEDRDETSEYRDAYSNLSKTTLSQQSKIFNEKKLKDSECSDLLNKVIYLLNQGEEFPDLEKSSMFFNVTKLFQMPPSMHQNLRRLIYVFIKELKVRESEVFIVISCLSKDIQQSDNEIVKANALRVLTKIIDEQYVQSLEKFIKQALNDKSDHVVSAALVSMIELYKRGGVSAELVKKSISELQDKLTNSKDGFVQYQALLILFELKKQDPMSCLKLLYQLAQQKVQTPITKCQLLRYIKQSLISNTALDQRTAKTFIAYIESCLVKDEDVVQFEAAKSICELFDLMGPAINVEGAFQVLIQLAQNAGKPVYKFAALRVINKIAGKQPRLIAMCQSELDVLVTDPNRSVASLAISTLLKTCKEDQVGKLLKQINSYLPELGLEFKIETIQSTALLYQRMPQKAGVLLKFLADCLKDDPNILFRESVVDTIIEICPSQREQSLLILSEHIEDCMQAQIQTKILNFLATEGPKAKNPASYIRFIYNRINLEKAVIRAAAVSALASFAFHVESLQASIILLLQKCLYDSDDEVRERANFYYNVLTNKEAEPYFDQETMIDIDALESYVLQNKDSLLEQDDFYIDLNFVEVEVKQTKEAKPIAVQPTVVSKVDEFTEALRQVAALKQFTEDHLFTTQKVNMNDQSAEYVISVVKHIYKKFVIVQYGVKNTLDDQVLSNLSIKITGLQADGLKLQGIVGLPESIKAGQMKFLYVVLLRTEGCDYPSCKISQKLSFVITEIDADTEEEVGSYDEDYSVQDVSLILSDYMVQDQLPQGHFKELWEALGSKQAVAEIIQTYQLPFKTMEDAVEGVAKIFNMAVCDKSNVVSVTDKAHNLLLCGMFLGKEMVMARAIIGFNQEYGCVLKVCLRSLSKQVAEIMAECVQ